MKTQAEVKAEVLESLQGAAKEAVTYDGEGFVIADTTGYHPMRVGMDGRVGFAGRQIFATRDLGRAHKIKAGLNAQYAAANITTRVEVVSAAKWKVERVRATIDLVAKLIAA